MRLFLIPLKTDFRKTELPFTVRMYQDLAPTYLETHTYDNIRGQIRKTGGMFLAVGSLEVQQFPKCYDNSTHPSLTACCRPKSCVSHMPPLFPSDGTPDAILDNPLRHAAHSAPRARGASLAVSITHELSSYTTTFGLIYHVFDGATTSVAINFFHHISSIHRLIRLSWPTGATFPVLCVVCATKCEANIYATPPPRPDTEPYPTTPDQDYD
ncbi:hypothetical protein P171DRAFT_479572 [Karstenula rhodostoma CBS 690.94]|uniref:Uncharacterized protein n=1 Tax=Karstenula rhodostoma CBS 690.94 TaxID=1392251 RepID=A0A9P4UIN5_9PLEO|nr:hypothetical protein P171DRAFT_479572 [Karstenula rhodostoma CBS 690.94]